MEVDGNSDEVRELIRQREELRARWIDTADLTKLLWFRIREIHKKQDDDES